MLTFTHKQFFALFFLFIKIKIAIVSRNFFAILIIKARNFVVLATSNSLRFNKDNLNIKFCNCNNKKKASLKEFRF